MLGACDEPLPGGGHIYALWNTTGELPPHNLPLIRRLAEARGHRITLVFFNTLMHALSEHAPEQDLDALATRVARNVAATAAAAKGWADVAWLPAPRVCGAAPGWAVKHFKLPK